MKRKIGVWLFLAVGAAGLAAGLVLMGTTMYYLANFYGVIHTLGQFGSMGGSAAGIVYLHYGMLITISALLIITGILLILRNVRSRKTRHAK